MDSRRLSDSISDPSLLEEAAVMTEVVVEEGGDEEVAVVVARLPAKFEGLAGLLAGRLEAFRASAVPQETGRRPSLVYQQRQAQRFPASTRPRCVLVRPRRRRHRRERVAEGLAAPGAADGMAHWAKKADTEW